MNESELEAKVTTMLDKLTAEEELIFRDMALGNSVLNVVNPMIAAVGGFCAGVLVAAWW